jgi:tetratricopeptide (TPR) repeat protein
MHIIPKDKWGVVVSNYKDLYGNVQDYTDQLRALEKAAKDKPDNPALRFLLGFHYAYLGFPRESVDQLDKVIKMQPQDEMAKALRDEMLAKLPKPIAPPAAQPVAPPTPEGPSAWIVPKSTPAARAA